MKPVRYFALLLTALAISNICAVYAAAPSEWVAQMNVTSECDMKKKAKAPKCNNCQKILMGWKCLDCDNEKKKCEKCKHLFLPEELDENKCPCCGSKNLVEAQLVIDGKCFTCGEETKIVDVCVKQVFACPEHSEYNDLKASTCREQTEDEKSNQKTCGKKLVSTGNVYSR